MKCNERIGRLLGPDKTDGCVYIALDSEYMVKKGIFGKRMPIKRDLVRWVINTSLPANEGVLDPEDKNLLEENKLRLKGKIYSIDWVNGDEANKIYDQYFNWEE